NTVKKQSPYPLFIPLFPYYSFYTIYTFYSFSYTHHAPRNTIRHCDERSEEAISLSAHAPFRRFWGRPYNKSLKLANL
ncbi:MAG: hypothetical protein R6T78_03485, partial [Dehalococcoidales bacterium]